MGRVYGRSACEAIVAGHRDTVKRGGRAGPFHRFAGLRGGMSRGAQGAPGVLQSVSIIRRIEKTRTNSVAHAGQR